MKNLNYISKIITTLLILIMFSNCNDFTNQVGKVIDLNKSTYYHFGTRDKDAIFYYSNAFLGDTPKQIKNADKKSFVVISKYCAKDKNSFYYKDLKIANVDYSTFTAETINLKKLDESKDEYSEILFKDRKNVYYLGDIYLSKDSINLEIIENADPNTYEILGKQNTNFWSKDNKTLFLNYKKFEADLLSFELINNNFAKDKSKLYFFDTNFYLSEPVNTTELEVLNPFYIRTNTNIYFLKNKELIKIDLQNPETIKIYGSNKLLINADGKLYINGIQLISEGLDYENFESLSNNYYSDGNSIYYLGFNSSELSKVTSDILSFSPIQNSSFGKDKKQVYYRDKIITDADPKTFEYNTETEIVKDAKGEFKYDSKQKNYLRVKK